MPIASISETDHADFLTLINAEIRPDRAKTNAWDDFPLILSTENRKWCLGTFAKDGELVAGMACLIRSFKTSCGIVKIAGIGSVVTKPAFRGQGLSSALQNEMLLRLHRNNIPLGVLWTDKPEIYAGRGFISAGYEFHIDFTDAALPTEAPTGFQVVNLKPHHVPAVEALYYNHSYHCVREPGDSRQLYLMPGTHGFIMQNSTGKVVAYVFCEKGGDFPDYIPEWGGEIGLVLPLLHKTRLKGKAHQILIPAGSVSLADSLIKRGAVWAAIPSGYWTIINNDALSNALPILDHVDPTLLLGTINEEGAPVPGLLEVGIWGFDSV